MSFVAAILYGLGAVMAYFEDHETTDDGRLVPPPDYSRGEAIAKIGRAHV